MIAWRTLAKTRSRMFMPHRKTEMSPQSDPTPITGSDRHRRQETIPEYGGED